MRSRHNPSLLRPYPLHSGRPQLRESIVLTADVLGFSNLVMESFRDSKLEETLDKTWEILTPRIHGLGDWGINQKERPFELKVFTDNIVIGWPIQQDGESEFGFTLMNVAYYQLELMLDGLFVRGAMDIGPAYIDDYLAFGPPIITSHLLETKKAKYPRIILSTELELLVKRHLEYYRDPQESPQYAHLLRDSDEMLFIDYLNVVFTTSDSIDDKKIYDLLTRHKDSIEHNLCVPAINESMRKKYEWSSNYHNYTVKRYMEANPKLIIPVNTDLGAPKSII